MSGREIVGVMLARNEDRFAGRAARNAMGFCDRFLAFDHGSRDGTREIFAGLEREFGPKFSWRAVRDAGESHLAIEGLAGTETWVFAVDGDEIYDPAGLGRMRARIFAGEFDRWWCVFGNVLNVTRLDEAARVAWGHLAPPCRSMTKLYNFAAIDRWSGRIAERLHGGEIAFRPGFDGSKRLALHEAVPWAKADFRCLHVCFLGRSSLDGPGAGPRKNIMDRRAWTAGKLWAKIAGAATGRPAPDWKLEKYARGPEVELGVAEFFLEGRE